MGRRVYLVTVPLPPKQTEPNFGIHSTGSIRARNRAKRSQRWHAKLAAIEAMGPTKPPRLVNPTIEATFYFPSRRNFRDRTNLTGWLKATIDGLQDSGLIWNDRKIRCPEPTQTTDRANPRVEFVVTPAEEAA